MTKKAWPPPDLTDWYEEVDGSEEPEWLLEGLLPASASVLLSGRPKRGHKTWFAYDMIYALATGERVAELIPTDPDGINILVLALEGPPKKLRQRWAWLSNANGGAIPRGRVWFAHRYPFLLDDPRWQLRLAELVQKKDIKLVVMDTLAKGIKGDENSAQDMGEVMRAVEVVCSAGEGTSFLCVHHLRKPSTQRGGAETDIDDDLRGSGAFAGAYDVHLAMREGPGGKGLMLTARQRDAEERYFKIEWDINKQRQVAGLSMEEYRPDAPVGEEFALQCLSKLEEGKVYTYRNLMEAWEIPGEMVNKVCGMLTTNGALVRMAKGWRRT